jgi:hypothetical protein
LREAPYPPLAEYSNALLGQVDTSIVADIPTYGAFKETGTQANRLVAYKVYGQAGAVQNIKVPVPVSVGTSPLWNRASWIQPPYDGGECSP